MSFPQLSHPPGSACRNGPAESINSLVLVALKFAPVHRLHMEAYRDAYVRSRGACEVTWIVADEYAAQLPETDRIIAVGPGKRNGSIARGFPRQCRRLLGLTEHELWGECSAPGKVHVFIQATHPANPVLVRRLRALSPRASVRYYLHEPTSWREKVRKGEGLITSTIVYLTQIAELQAVDEFYVAHQRALDSAERAFPLPHLASRGRLLTLLFRDLCPGYTATTTEPTQVLFLGRADHTRCTDLFLEAAAEAERRNLGWTFVLLSGRSPPIPAWAQQLQNLSLRIGRAYSNDEMATELARSRFVFNVYRVPYSQSGVTPVSLMFGVPVIAHAQERIPELEDAGCIYFQREPTATEFLDRLEAAPPAHRAALRNWYLEHFDAGVVSIPP